MLVELLKQGKQVLMDYKGFTALIDPTDPKNCLQEVKNEYSYRQIAQQKQIWCIIDGVTPKVGHDFDGGELILVSSPKKEIIGDSHLRAANLNTKVKVIAIVIAVNNMTPSKPRRRLKNAKRIWDNHS